MSDYSEIDLAWAAGLVDGEGSIFNVRLSARPKYIGLCIAIQMTEKHPIERFAKIFQLKVKDAGKTKSDKPVYATTTQNANKVKEIFGLLTPYLSEHKIKQGENAISIRNKYENDPEKGKRDFCRNGHKFPENRRIWPNGNGYCIICLEERRKRKKV